MMNSLVRDQVQSRQYQLIHPHLAGAHVMIVGAGMVGGWATMAFARVAKSVTTWDHDIVGRENVGCQPYHLEQVGEMKAAALADNLRGLEVDLIGQEFNHGVKVERGDR